MNCKKGMSYGRPNPRSVEPRWGSTIDVPSRGRCPSPRRGSLIEKEFKMPPGAGLPQVAARFPGPLTLAMGSQNSGPWG
jgi:hypothetical protein